MRRVLRERQPREQPVQAPTGPGNRQGGGQLADDIAIQSTPTGGHINPAQRTPAEKDYIAHEWRYGPYERMVSILKAFGGEASAIFGNGQLALRAERGDGRESGKVVVPPSTAGTTDAQPAPPDVSTRRGTVWHV